MSHRDELTHAPGVAERGSDWLDGALAGWLLFIAISAAPYVLQLGGGIEWPRAAWAAAPFLALAAIFPLLRFHRIGWFLALLALGLMTAHEAMDLAAGTRPRAAAVFLVVHLLGMAYLLWIIPEFWPKDAPAAEPAAEPAEAVAPPESADPAEPGPAVAPAPAPPIPVTLALASIHQRIVAAGSACSVTAVSVRAEAGRFGVTPAVLRTEGLALYRTFLQHFLADGTLSPEEERELICLERALDLDDDGVWRLRGEAGLRGGAVPSPAPALAAAPSATLDRDESADLVDSIPAVTSSDRDEPMDRVDVIPAVTSTDRDESVDHVNAIPATAPADRDDSVDSVDAIDGATPVDVVDSADLVDSSDRVDSIDRGVSVDQDAWVDPDASADRADWIARIDAADRADSVDHGAAADQHDSAHQADWLVRIDAADQVEPVSHSAPADQHDSAPRPDWLARIDAADQVEPVDRSAPVDHADSVDQPDWLARIDATDRGDSADADRAAAVSDASDARPPRDEIAAAPDPSAQADIALSLPRIHSPGSPPDAPIPPATPESATPESASPALPEPVAHDEPAAPAASAAPVEPVDRIEPIGPAASDPFAERAAAGEIAPLAEVVQPSAALPPSEAAAAPAEAEGLRDYEEHELGALLRWAGIPALPRGTPRRAGLERLRALHRTSTEPLAACASDHPLEPGERCLAVRTVELYRVPPGAPPAPPPADLPGPVLDPRVLVDGTLERDRDLSAWQRTGVCRFLLTERRLLLVAPSGQQSPLPVSRLRAVRPYRNGLEVQPQRGHPVFLAFGGGVDEVAMLVDRAAADLRASA